jgi:putative ABC transport system permease protein
MKKDELAMVASMSFRNLGRHRTKTVITTIAVAVSVSLYIIMDAWLLGMNVDSRRNIVIYEMGAVKIQSDAYFAGKDDLPMYESFGGWEDLSERLDKAGFRSAPRFVFSGTVHSRSGTAPVLFNAVDTEREKALLRYPDYVETGRFPAPGTREAAMGTLAAERLHVGIPRRPAKEVFEEELVAAARNAEEEEFIRGLYELYIEANVKKTRFEKAPSPSPAGGRMILRNGASPEDLAKLWDILADSGRMDIRISTTIDIKALPERILKDTFTLDILPTLSPEDRAALESVYRKDAVLEDYILVSDQGPEAEKALAVLIAGDYDGAIRHVNQLIDAKVVGVINSPNPKNNANIAYVPLDGLQDGTGLMLGGRITELLVRSSSAKDAALPGASESPEAVTAALGGSLPEGLSARSWEAYSEDYFAAAAGDQVSTRLMIFFLFILSFLGIANTMLMAILERTREIGMLRALGMTDAQLLLSYTIEAAMVGIIGSAAGVIIGCAVNIPMVNIGIDYSGLADALNGDYGYRIASYFRSAWNVPVIVGTFIVASALSGCTAILPTLRALAMPVTESLRFE